MEVEVEKLVTLGYLECPKDCPSRVLGVPLDGCCCLGVLVAPDLAVSEFWWLGTLLLSQSFGSSRDIVGNLQLSCGDCPNLVRDR